MNESEERLAWLRSYPLGCRTEHGIGGSLDLRGLLARIRPEVERAVVKIESLSEAKPRIEHIAADESSSAIAIGPEHSGQRDDIARDLVSVFLHMVNERICGG